MPLLDPLTQNAPSAVATGPPGQRRIDLLFASGQLARQGKRNLWHRYWREGHGWSPSTRWRQRGGVWGSQVVGVAYSGGRIDAFGLGTDGNLYHAWGLGDALNGDGEWPEEPIGAPSGRRIVSSPAALALGPASFIVGVRTVRIDDGRPGIWFATFEGGGIGTPGTWRWRRHLDQAGTWPVAKSGFATALGMAYRKPGSLDLFTVTGDYELVHNWRDGDVSGDWELLSKGNEGGYTTTPSVAPWWYHDNPDLSSLHAVACYGPFELTGGAVLLKSWLGKHWAEQRTIYTEGSTDRRGVLGPPAVASWGKPYLEVFFLSAADRLGGGLGLTQGSTQDLLHWSWRVLPPPPLA